VVLLGKNGWSVRSEALAEVRSCRPHRGHPSLRWSSMAAGPPIRDTGQRRRTLPIRAMPRHDSEKPLDSFFSVVAVGERQEIKTHQRTPLSRGEASGALLPARGRGARRCEPGELRL
jgi:hypothetical protein